MIPSSILRDEQPYKGIPPGASCVAEVEGYNRTSQSAFLKLIAISETAQYEVAFTSRSPNRCSYREDATVLQCMRNDWDKII